jgi:hypothetical protein
MVLLDIDNKDETDPVTMDHAAAQLDGLEHVLYSTASNRGDPDKFRVVVPLSAPVDRVMYKAALRAICRHIAGRIACDPSKQVPYMIFYVPAQYAGAVNRFVHHRGEILSAEAWIEVSPEPEIERPVYSIPTYSRDDIETDWTLDGYRATEIANWYMGQSDDRYLKIYSAMCQCAKSARGFGYELRAGELANWAHSLHRANHGKSMRKTLLRDESDAIDWAESEVDFGQWYRPTPKPLEPSTYVHDRDKGKLLALMGLNEIEEQEIGQSGRQAEISPMASEYDRVLCLVKNAGIDTDVAPATGMATRQ